MLKKITLFLCLLPVLSGFAIPKFDGNLRQTYNFNSDWKLQIGDISNAQQVDFNDSGWKKITLPRAFNEDEAFRVPIAELTDTVVWYRKHFKLPLADKDKKVFIEFEGVRYAGDVFVNGKEVGLHENGVMAFGFDISSFIKFGEENVIAVRVDNDWNYHEKATHSTFQWNNKNFNANYGGIPKNVILHVTGKVYQTLALYSMLKTTGTYIYATNFDIKGRKAVIHAESEVRNEENVSKSIDYEVIVEDMDGKIISRFATEKQTIAPNQTIQVSASAKVSGLHFWSWGYGYLYHVYTVLKIDGKPVDVVKTRTGFRKTEFKNGMVYLNDRVIQMKGYAQRTSNEWPAVGMSVPAWLSDFSNGMIVKGNGNMIRWMHVTPWKQDVESCDRVGLMQMFPAGDAEGDVTGRRWEQRKELMRDAIIYNRNSPSVLLFECGNESISEEHMAEMKAIRDQYDPNGGRAIGAREMLDSKIAEYGGEMLYINKSAGKPMIASEYCRDEALRKYWDEFTPPYHKNGAGPLYRNADASDYNRNQDSFAKEDVIRWNDYFICRPGTGKRVSSGGLNIVFSDTNTHCRGEENYRRSGEVDAERIPKDAYFAHQAMWDGWVDVEKPHTYIIGHWNYAPNVVKDVMVVSPSDKVELFLNGKSLGFGENSYNFLHTYKNIVYQSGTLKAVSYNSNGKEISSDSKMTAGEPVALKLSLIKSSLAVKADGADMVLVQVEVVDAKGQRCPAVFTPVTFKLDGPAEWRGGIAQGPDNYILSKTLPAECGINRALIRTTTQSGKVTIMATAEGLTSSSISFETVPVIDENGLNPVLADAGLPSILSRGETPSTPSYKITRKTIDIISATAGANADKAGLSYDDNELSEWTNDGKIATGWITYQLANEALISEVSLKLTGWRTLSYPIEILVDKAVVWTGKTAQSLGYITIPLTPTKGKLVTIRLTGSNTEKDAFQNMIEVNGNKELDGFKDPKNANTKGQLRIVEAEVYEKIISK
ncbi:MAG: sugar-binding domain-containing protein [Paludibacter sp.]